jgi:hypothetical protein
MIAFDNPSFLSITSCNLDWCTSQGIGYNNNSHQPFLNAPFPSPTQISNRISDIASNPNYLSNLDTSFISYCLNENHSITVMTGEMPLLITLMGVIASCDLISSEPLLTISLNTDGFPVAEKDHMLWKRKLDTCANEIGHFRCSWHNGIMEFVGESDLPVALTLLDFRGNQLAEIGLIQPGDLVQIDFIMTFTRKQSGISTSKLIIKTIHLIAREYDIFLDNEDMIY